MAAASYCCCGAQCITTTQCVYLHTLIIFTRDRYYHQGVIIIAPAELVGASIVLLPWRTRRFLLDELRLNSLPRNGLRSWASSSPLDPWSWLVLLLGPLLPPSLSARSSLLMLILCRSNVSWMCWGSFLGSVVKLSPSSIKLGDGELSPFIQRIKGKVKKWNKNSKHFPVSYNLW